MKEQERVEEAPRCLTCHYKGMPRSMVMSPTGTAWYCDKCGYVKRRDK